MGQGYSKKLSCTQEYRETEYKINDFKVIECNCDCTMQNNKFFIKNIKDNHLTYELSEVSKIIPSNKFEKNLSSVTEYFLKNKKYCKHMINIKKDNLYFFTLVPITNGYCYELSAYVANKKIKILKNYVKLVTHTKIKVKKALLYKSPNGTSNGYLLKNDNIEILKEKDNWVYVLYDGEIKIKAWVHKQDIFKAEVSDKVNNHSLSFIEKSLKGKEQLDVYNLEFFKKYLPEKPIEKKTLTPYNNIAYYLQKAGANEEAVYLLEKILEKFPKRTVAYYNLADAYWALGEKKKAVKAYKTYIKQMKAKGKEKRIPKVVKQRVSGK